MRHGTVLRTFGFLLGLGLSVEAGAQTTSTIYGVVQDPQGQVLPGVTISVESPALRRGVVTTVTNGEGRYRVPGLQAGLYKVTADVSGFATAVLSDVNVPLNTEIQVDIIMQVAGVQETVTVNAEIPIVRLKESDFEQSISNETIDSIPLNGRQFLDLVSLVPGVAARPVGEDQGAGVTVFGERSITNSFLIDGFDNNDPYTRGFSEFFVQDAIQEFEVLLGGYQAEFGRASGAVLNVITRSGTNQLQGRVFGFFRNDALDASNIEGQEAPELSRQEVGGTIGGPIFKDRTFFFESFQLFREERGLNFDQSVLPRIIRDGFYTPSLGQEPFDRVPLDKRYTNLLKIDHRINGQNQVFVTFNLNRGTNDNFLPDPNRGFAAPPPGTIVLPSISSDLREDTTSVNGRYTAFFSNAAFLESSFRVAHLEFAENVGRPSEAEQLFPLTFTPGFTVWMSNASPIAAVDRRQDRIQWAEDLSYFKDTGSGSHEIKLGIDLDRVSVEHLFLPAQGIIIGNTALDSRFDQLGYHISMQRNNIPILSANLSASATDNKWAFYVQDSWSPNERLTLNLGVRYDVSSLFSEDKNNFAPRLGLSFDLGNKGKTVLRSAFGRYYDQTILESIATVPELGGVQFGFGRFQILSRGGSFFNNPSIGAFGPLQDSGTRWLANPRFYSFIIPQGQVRSSGGISITGQGQPYIVYDLLGIPVPDRATPPVLTFSSISELTGGRLTPEAALAILNGFFPGPGYDQFIFLEETGSASINTGRPLTFMFQPPAIDAVHTILRPVKTAYTDSFSIGVEQALGAGLSIDAEVFIRRSRNLLARRVINLLDSPVSANCNGNTTDGGPCIGQLQYNGFLDTNALLVALKKRLAGRSSFLLSYTFTDATDNFSTLRVPPSAGEQTFLRNNDPSLDVGKSLNTPEHVFVFSGFYKLPYGFELSGVLNATSGRPFNAAGLPLDSDGDGQFDNRLLGTEKGAYRTDPFFNIDLRIAKELRLAGRTRITALLEVFNLTNRANPYQVNRACADSDGNGLPDVGGCSAAGVGQTLQPTSGREMQIGLRFDF